MEAEELPEETDGILEFTTREEYITCLLILDSMVSEMYEELFDQEEE